MNIYELKAKHEYLNPQSYFFARKTMKFFKDTLRNFGVKSGKIENENEIVDVWIVYRKHCLNPYLSMDKEYHFRKDNFKLLN